MPGNVNRDISAILSDNYINRRRESFCQVEVHRFRQGVLFLRRDEFEVPAVEVLRVEDLQAGEGQAPCEYRQAEFVFCLQG